MVRTLTILSMLISTHAAAASGAGEPVWRFWSPVLSGHFYTISEQERDWVQQAYADVWEYEGIAHNAYGTAEDANLAPVHRFWSGPLSGHFYTIDEAERDLVLSQYPDVWTCEGIAFYAYPPGAQPAGTTPVYRFWSDQFTTHFYTAGDAERFAVLNYYAGAWVCEGVAWYAWPAESAAATEIVKGPYLLRPEPNAMTVMWETNVPAPSRVEYGTASLAESLVEDTNSVTLHQVALMGLAADTAYVYRVASAGAVSQVGSFTTAPSPDRSFRFVVYGDSQADPNAHAEVVRSVIDSAPQIVLRTGDIVLTGRDYERWVGECFAPARELLLTTPMMLVPGNHDYGGTGPLWFFYFFDLPYSAGWSALTYGNTRFIGLDTNVDFAPGSEQYEWLLDELTCGAYDEATWRVVFFHHPPFTATTTTSGRGHFDDVAVKTHLVPLFESYGIDLVFNGHSHVYERYRHNGITYIVTGGGGGPLYSLREDTEPPVRQFGLSTYHHCVVDVDTAERTLTISAVDNDGQVFDTVELQR